MMKMNKTHLIVALVMAILVFTAGFFVAKGMYDRPLDESVTRDTVTLHDTVPEYLPVPKDSARIKWVTRWLPAKPGTHHVADVGKMMDSIYQLIGGNNMMPDTVAVQVPITSKHYSGKNYDAYVSGYQPSLDSIKVYQRTEYITETITRMKPPNKLSLEVEAGVDYMTRYKDMNSFAFGDLTYRIKDSRFSVGMRGGVVKMPADKAQPFFGGVIKYRVF